MVPKFVSGTGGSQWKSALPGGFAGKLSGRGGMQSAAPTHNPQGILRIQLVKKGFDKLVDGEASSPATATLTSFC